jgi:hypothetical protein
VLYAVATCLVAVGGAWLLRLDRIAKDWVLVMMCHWAQRHGQDAEMSSQHGKHRLYFRTEPKG